MGSITQYGLDCGFLGTGFSAGDKAPGRYSIRPVLNTENRVMGYLFGPHWALAVTDLGKFVEDVVENQIGSGSVSGDEEYKRRVEACYFGWVTSYSAVAYSVSGMKSVSESATGQWRFLRSMMPDDQYLCHDIIAMAFTYGHRLCDASDRAAFRGTSLKQQVNALVSGKKAYKVDFGACPSGGALSQR